MSDYIKLDGFLADDIAFSGDGHDFYKVAIWKDRRFLRRHTLGIFAETKSGIPCVIDLRGPFIFKGRRGYHTQATLYQPEEPTQLDAVMNGLRLGLQNDSSCSIGELLVSSTNAPWLAQKYHDNQTEFWIELLMLTTSPMKPLDRLPLESWPLYANDL